MHILHIHKYFNKMRSGGSISAFFETRALFEKKGHMITVFSMKNAQNELSPYGDFFAEHFDVNEAKTLGEKMRLVPKILYNRDAERKLDALLDELERKGKKPDVAHVHDIHHYLTPSIFGALKKHRIPILLKLSDYKLICPSYLMFSKGDICERCKGGRYYNAFFQKCLKNSRAASLVISAEAYFHAFRRSFDAIDSFVAPSVFMKEKCVSFGIDGERIKVLRNVLNFGQYAPSFSKKRYGLYAGRISQEKGLLTLVEAVKMLKEKNLLGDFRFVVMGEGPQEEGLKRAVTEAELEKEIEIIGFRKKGSEEWTRFMSEAAFSVLPSIWYDNSPVAISESMALGTSVIVSDRGGTKEMIEDGESGFVFEAKNANDLAEKMRRFIDNPTLCESMGRSAVERVKVINNEEKYYERLMQIYREVIQKQLS